MNRSIRESHIALYFISGCFLLVLFACTPPPPPATLTPTPSSTPSLTPSPTATLTPTAAFTLTPSPTLTPLVPDRGQVLFSESFDDNDFPFYICSGMAHTEAGILIVQGEPSSCGIFSNGMYGIDPIPPDATLVVLFKTTSDFNIGLHDNNYNEGTLHRFGFGITQGIATWDISTGSKFYSKQTTALKSDRWYYFMVKRSSTGEIEAKFWQPDAPENAIEFQTTLEAEWGTTPLMFVADFKDVPFLVDEYQILQ